MRRRRSDESNEIAQDLGMPTCPTCGQYWTEEFVPKHCTRCGAQVADQAGPGWEPHIRRAQKFGKPVPLIHCPRCGERYLKRHYPAKCLRCYSEVPSGIRRGPSGTWHGD